VELNDPAHMSLPLTQQTQEPETPLLRLPIVLVAGPNTQYVRLPPTTDMEVEIELARDWPEVVVAAADQQPEEVPVVLVDQPEEQQAVVVVEANELFDRQDSYLSPEGLIILQPVPPSSQDSDDAADEETAQSCDAQENPRK